MNLENVLVVQTPWFGFIERMVIWFRVVRLVQAGLLGLGAEKRPLEWTIRKQKNFLGCQSKGSQPRIGMENLPKLPPGSQLEIVVMSNAAESAPALNSSSVPALRMYWTPNLECHIPKTAPT